MSKTNNSAETILKRLRKTAKLAAAAYSVQHEDSVEEFLQKHVVNVVPESMRNLLFVAEIISDMARADIMGIELSLEKQKEHRMLVLENLDELLQESQFPLPKELEKFRKYGFPVLMKTAQFRNDARTMIAMWKSQDDISLDEFLKEHTRCSCGECDPFDKAGDIFSEVLTEMAHVSLEDRRATEAEVERWLIRITEAHEFAQRKTLLKNITLN